MVLCPSCGVENREDATFCGECGATLTAELVCNSCGRNNPPGRKFCDGCGQSLTDAAPPTRTPTPQPSPALPASFADGRYQVQRFLGEGGRKRVYLAHDSKLDRDVAIAVIKTEGLDEASLTRVHREAQAMGRLGDHPHIVTIHDIGEEVASAGSGQAPQAYIVSQYMAGGDLEGLLQQAEGHRLSLFRALRIADEVRQALEHAHGHGIIHRDLKPGNIWLTENGTAKLGDFGLAMAADRSRVTVAGMMLGTVAYMPPEQALGREADARSDLYSLGCVLYEMVTGRPPFLGDDTVAIISQHINTAPVAPTWHNPEVPRALEALIMRLLAKDPDERPESAAAVLEVLNAVVATAATAADEATQQQANPLDRLAGGVFVGREKEMDELRAGLEDALSGRGRLLMLVGEPGIGKTRTSEEFATYAGLRNTQVLWGRCYEGEGAPAYWPWVQVIRSYVHDRDAQALMSEMGPGAADIAQVVSDVREQLPGLAAPPDLEPEQARFRLFDSITTFLKNASNRQPIVLVLDDLHWADKPSLLLLQFLARELRGARLMVLGTYRDVELRRQHPLSQTLGELAREQLSQRILLRGLTERDVARFIEITAGLAAPQALVDAVYRETEGNPFFVNEIVRLLVADGRLERPEEVKSWSVTIPQGVREVVGRRLDHLSEECNRVLTIGSVIGREFELHTLEKVSDDLSGDRLLEALEEAVAARVIAEMPRMVDHYSFTHALIRETLYEELSTTRRVRLHRQIGEVLEELHGADLEPHVAQLAHHFYQGNDPAKAIDYSRRAGEAALRVYAWEEAIRHWEAALELMDEQGDGEEERAQLLERLGDITYVSGIDYEKGISFLERALSIYEGLGARGKVAAMHSRVGRGMVSMIGRVDLEKGPAHLEAARAILEEDAPGSAGLAYVYLGLCTAYSMAYQREKGLDYSRRALEIGERLNSRPVIANALAFVGWFLLATGELREASDLMERGWRIADEDSLTFIAFLGSWFRGTLSLFARGDPRDAAGWFQRELDKPRLASAPFMRWNLLGFLGQAHVLAGEMEEARRIRDAGNDFRPFLTRLLVSSGDWEAAEEGLLRGLEGSRRAGNFAGLQGSSTTLGELFLRRGQYERAEEHLRTSLEIEERTGVIGTGGMNTRVMLAQVLARTGRLNEAQEQVNVCLGVLAGGEDWGATGGHVVLAHGVVLGAQAKWAEAEEALDETLATARQYRVPWDEADALHERARLHLARGNKGDREQALRLLDDTIAIYQRLEATKHLEFVLADKLQAQGIDPAATGTSIEAVASAVYVDKPDLRSHAAPDGTVTILFSDIEGSTAMTERLGDQRWMGLLRAHNAIVREQVAAHEGFEVKSAGDGFMLAFQSARRALECAVDIQRAFAQRNESAEEPVRVRIGLHTGEALKEADDFFGKNVILAARIAGQAQGSEILVSSLLKELTESAGDIAFGEGREVELKGLSGQHHVFEVGWE